MRLRALPLACGWLAAGCTEERPRGVERAAEVEAPMPNAAAPTAENAPASIDEARAIEIPLPAASADTAWRESSCFGLRAVCRGDCRDIVARIPDEANRCVTSKAVGCGSFMSAWNDEPTTSCFTREDGAVVQMFGLYGDQLGPEWQQCTAEDAKRVQGLPECARGMTRPLARGVMVVD